MTEEKQIDEMAKDICVAEQKTNYRCTEKCKKQGICAYCKVIAETLYNAGYRKQSEGEWNTIVDNKDDIVTECSACKKHFWFMKKGQLNIDRMPFCPNCGAKMKGGAE